MFTLINGTLSCGRVAQKAFHNFLPSLLAFRVQFTMRHKTKQKMMNQPKELGKETTFIDDKVLSMLWVVFNICWILMVFMRVLDLDGLRQNSKRLLSLNHLHEPHSLNGIQAISCKSDFILSGKYVLAFE